MDDHLIACEFFRSPVAFLCLSMVFEDDLTEKKTVEFRKDTQENAPCKAWNYLARHITDDLIETILHDSANQQNQSGGGHHAVKKARRTNDATQKIRPSYGKATGTSAQASKGKRATRRSRMWTFVCLAMEKMNCR